MASTLNREIWIGEVAKFIVQDPNFTSGVKNDNTLVDKYGVVNLPQMLTKPTISTYSKGVTVLPLTAVAASADILAYNTQLEHSDLIYADAVDSAQFSFNILAEAQLNVANAFIERKQLILANNWAVTATNSLKEATGTARVNSFGTSYKGLADADFINAAISLDKQNISRQGRRAVISPSMLGDLLTFSTQANFNTLGVTDEAIKRGAVGMYRGFEIYVSNYNPAFTLAGVKRPVGEATLATDKESAIFYHPDYVRGAVSEPLMHVDNGAAYLTDEVFVMKMWIGGSSSYKAVANTVYGIVTFIEGTV